MTLKRLCLSHVKDIDGISSAALVRAATGCEFMLVDYDSLFDALDGLPAGLEELYICDLGTDQSRFAAFLERMRRLSESVSITYIDHHYLAPDDRAALKRLPIKLVHSVNDCAGMLTYLTFKSSLPEEAKMIALYAAVTDYLDGSRKARRIMETYDRHLILFESTLLSYALAMRGKDLKYPRMLVEQLSKMRLPHQIPGVPDSAVAQANVVLKLMKKVRTKGTMLHNVAYFETDVMSTGIVAKLLLGAFGAAVGVSLRRKSGARTEMSLRCTSECKVHLGRTIGAIAEKHGGNGGGHARAAGCTVPTSEALNVLRDLDEAVSTQA
jgi:single-stranded DNA-specific DHH superfamily exonuclease